MKLPRLPMVLLLCCGCVVTFYAQPRSRSATRQADNAQQKKPLQLTASIINQKYCVGDAELDVLGINVRLTFTNIGRQPLILYKGSSLVSRIMISRNQEDAAARRFEVDATFTHVTTGGRKRIDEPVPGKLFVILPPGGSFETETGASVFVAREESGKIEGSVKSGDHVLLVEVATWTGSKELAERLRTRWQRYGLLWYEPVISQPLPFKVEKRRVVENCP